MKIEQEESLLLPIYLSMNPINHHFIKLFQSIPIVIYLNSNVPAMHPSWAYPATYTPNTSYQLNSTNHAEDPTLRLYNTKNPILRSVNSSNSLSQTKKFLYPMHYLSQEITINGQSHRIFQTTSKKNSRYHTEKTKDSNSKSTSTSVTRNPPQRINFCFSTKSQEASCFSSTPESLKVKKQQNTAEKEAFGETPVKRKPKKMAQLRERVLKDIYEARSVESKFIGSSTRHHIEESEIVFKGSRDIVDVKPLKLFDDQLHYPELVKIRKSHCSILVRELKTKATFLIFELSSSEQVLHDLPEIEISFMKPYYSTSSGHPSTNYVISEGFQYTLMELIQMGRVGGHNFDLIYRHLQKPLALMQSGHGIHWEKILQSIYYIHGVFKILPIVCQNGKKGSINQNLRDRFRQILIKKLQQ